ncbi:MAG: diaminopimelate epimerase [Acidimicrobiia bacterium]|nr:diaminopimelate epimerase [Acidimicrobiia bacterium]MDH3471325.1 diaminopimelate epimerase [Acidimicrobiia bacterium]
MDFVKMHALGNDFVVVDGVAAPSTEDIVAWCDRRRGIGADGVLLVSAEAGGVRMRYWNADGSGAETCGNGVRCVARLAVDRAWVEPGEFTVFTDAGPAAVVATQSGPVRAQLASPSPPGSDVEIAGFTFHTVSMGNPHAVTIVDDCYATPVEALGPIVEGDPSFPDRTNVEFISRIESDTIAARIWERGVGETLASGTGGAASAVVAHRQGLVGESVKVQLVGGTLLVELANGEVWTEGPAAYSFQGSI